MLNTGSVSIFAVCKTDVEDITVADNYGDSEVVVYMNGYNVSDDTQRISLINRVNTSPGTEINRATAQLEYSNNPGQQTIDYNDEDNWTTEDR